MNCKCVRCGAPARLNKGRTNKILLKYINEGIYICRSCRMEVIEEELMRLLNEKRKRRAKVY